MTNRLYYADAYCHTFAAVVTGAGELEGRPWVTLDQSAFYPTSGGQPHDTGELVHDGQTMRVHDVTVNAQGEVLHHTDTTLDIGTRVTGRIDWPRRFDHMQQHLGEHLLAGVIARLTGGYTIGLHIGNEDATIDVTLPDGAMALPRDTWLQVEETVNGHIFANLPVRCWFPDAQTLAELPLRKAPAVRDHVRVVAAGDVEMVACGGTHPDSTAQVGLVKVLGTEPARGQMCVHFVCGRRALHGYQSSFDATQAIGRLLSAPIADLPQAVKRLQDRLAQCQTDLHRLRLEMMRETLATQMAHTVATPAGWRVIKAVLDQADMDLLSVLAGELTGTPGVIALLCGIAGERPAFVFARSEDVDADMVALLRKAGIRGGGTAGFARGSANDNMEAALVLEMSGHGLVGG